MIAYIRRMKDWSVIAWAEPIDWELPVYSNDNSNGSFLFAPDATITKGLEGEWIAFGTHLWVIDQIKPSEESIEVRVLDAFNAFYRWHLVPSGYNTTGAFLAAILNINYKAQGDAEYAMPYLNVTNTDTTTALLKPTLKNDVIFQMSAYMREAVKRYVKIEITPDTNGVKIDISARTTTNKTLVMGDGHNQLVKIETSSNIVSKVNVVYQGATHQWYLQHDGSASWTTIPNPRIPGRWETIVINDDNTVEQDVLNVFAKNTASIQIEFYSDKTLEFNESIQIIHKGVMYKTQISYVEINSNDNRYHYKAGDMPTTLLEKLRLVMNAQV